VRHRSTTEQQHLQKFLPGRSSPAIRLLQADDPVDSMGGTQRWYCPKLVAIFGSALVSLGSGSRVWNRCSRSDVRGAVTPGSSPPWAHDQNQIAAQSQIPFLLRPASAGGRRMSTPTKLIDRWVGENLSLTVQSKRTQFARILRTKLTGRPQET